MTTTRHPKWDRVLLLCPPTAAHDSLLIYVYRGEDGAVAVVTSESAGGRQQHRSDEQWFVLHSDKTVIAQGSDSDVLITTWK